MAPTRKPAAKQTAKSEVDAQLAKYRSMRDFAVTLEPSGSKAKQASAKSQLSFVIQKHAATRLHYDFRLGWRGVLKSWAVTKGPSYVPADKRLAVEVEDHPMEYGGFEGTIPKGQYGGGTVMLWDQGTWEPLPGVDVDAALKAGNLKFLLHGKKLHGKWALIRMGGKAAQESKPNWLLIKEHDEHERGPKDPAVTEEEPDSVLTKRDLGAIGREQDHVWQSKPAKGAETKRSAEARLRARLQAKTGASKPASSRASTVARETKAPAHHRFARGRSSRTKPEPAPGFLAPQLASQGTEPPSGDGWIHELKYDGYRMQAVCDGGDVRLLTRSGLDWTHRMPTIADALVKLDLDGATLDGEVVVLNEHGETDFAALQAAFDQGPKSTMLYCVFDLMRSGGKDISRQPLLQRKQSLADLLKRASKSLRYSEHVVGTGAELFAEACRLGAEGIVSKRSNALYRSGRQPDWIKVKCYRRQELVVGGFTLPTHAQRGIGALLLGYYHDGKLIHAGRTGTGFTEASGQKLRQKLDKLKSSKMPFESVDTAARKGAIWVKPELVCEVSFATWTADGSVRQASFQGLREDKNAKEVRREQLIDTQKLAGETEMPAEPKRPIAKSKQHAKIHLTHPDKVLDEETGVTKQQLADYLAAVSSVMLAHVQDRPVSLVRCPEGVGKPCFYQKHVSKGMPQGLGIVKVPDRDGKNAEEYVTVETALGLQGTAQMGALEVHPWGSKNGSLEKPDRLIFDLDPDTSLEWSVVADAAKKVRSLLQKRGLKSFVKLSGGKGLHVVLPIEPEHEWPAIKVFCRRIAEELESSDPQRYLIKMTKSARVGKIFIDYLRNERGATAIAPWGPRARAGMPCAVPLTWEELSKEKTMTQFRVADFPAWRSRVQRDPWRALLTTHQRLRKQDIAIPEAATARPASNQRRGSAER